MELRLRRPLFMLLGINALIGTLSGCGGDDETTADVVAAAIAQASGKAPSPQQQTLPTSTATPVTNVTPPASPATTDTGTVTAGTRSATLSWAAPTEYEDGSVLANLAGYRIWYGSAPGKYSKIIEIAPGTTSHNIHGLAAATYYFSITAYNHEGVESALSNEVAITL